MSQERDLRTELAEAIEAAREFGWELVELDRTLAPLLGRAAVILASLPVVADVRMRPTVFCCGSHREVICDCSSQPVIPLPDLGPDPLDKHGIPRAMPAMAHPQQGAPQGERQVVKTKEFFFGWYEAGERPIGRLVNRRERAGLFQQLDGLSCGEPSRFACLDPQQCLGHLRAHRREVQANYDYANRAVLRLRDLISKPPKVAESSSPEQGNLL